MNDLDDDKASIKKVIKYIGKIGGYERAAHYLALLCEAPSRINVGPVECLRNITRVRILQRPREPMGPERLVPHQLRVIFKRKQ